MSDDERDGTESTVCPFCAVGCRLGPGEERDRATGVAGPANPDGHLCPKGIESYDALGGRDRLSEPMVRRDGTLQTVSWETALDRAAESLGGLAAAFGADALSFLGAPHCTNEENYLLQKLARSLGTNNVDNRARICHASAMTALETRLGRPAMTNSLADLQQADVFLVVGANPARQQPVAFDAFVRPAVDDGATLVHVDPRATRTTRAADVHLSPRPGSDALVVRLLAALLYRADQHDQAFVAGRTTGFPEYADSLAGVDVEAGAALAGVDSDALDRVADRIGAAERTAVVAGTGIEDGDHEATDTADALLNLLLLTGNLGRPGTGMNVLRGLNNEQGATDAGCRPDRLPGHQPVGDDAARERVAEEWGVVPPSTPGLDERAALGAFGDEIRGALVVGENPAVAKRDEDWVAERLSALETLVVIDIAESETTEYADVVLPAASGLEKAGTVTNLDRRLQRVRPTVTPPGAARPDHAILRDLGSRLVGDGFDYDDPAAVFEEWTRVSPVHDGLSWTDVADGGRQWPAPSGEPDQPSILYDERFETPSGRAPFASVETEVPTVAPEELLLLVGSRAGGFAPEDLGDERVHVSGRDAAARGIDDADPVVVRNDAAAVRTTVEVDDHVRAGAAYLHADAAEPLVRERAATVRIRPR